MKNQILKIFQKLKKFKSKNGMEQIRIPRTQKKLHY